VVWGLEIFVLGPRKEVWMSEEVWASRNDVRGTGEKICGFAEEFWGLLKRFGGFGGLGRSLGSKEKVSSSGEEV
jgi:hypothetical protein